MLDYEISPADASTLLKENGARLVDVREPWEFAKARIEGSLLIPMGEVPRAHTRNWTRKSGCLWFAITVSAR